MEWNVTICSSSASSSLLALSNKNQLLGMASPQVSSSIRDQYNTNEGGSVHGAAGGIILSSPKRQYYSAFMMQQDELAEMEEMMGGYGDAIAIGPHGESSASALSLSMAAAAALKKRRLTMDQVRYLETSFEAEHKLEPERKVQIAKQLGLQPRQVAVWFQNRRARSKSKQLERDFNALKADYNAVLKENDKLRGEVEKLRLMVKMKGSIGTGSSLREGEANEDEEEENNISSTSMEVKIEPDASTSTPCENESLVGGDDTSSSPTNNHDEMTSMLPVGAVIATTKVAEVTNDGTTAATVITTTKVTESATEATTILSEDLHIFTMQHAHQFSAAANLAHHLAAKLEGDDSNLIYATQWPDENIANLVITHYWDEPWSD